MILELLEFDLKEITVSFMPECALTCVLLSPLSWLSLDVCELIDL